MLARLSEYQILSERVASLSIHWPPRRSMDHRENTTYAYFGARTASSRISCMQKGEQAKSGGRHWDQCPVCKKSRGLERYSGPFYFPVTRYQFPLPADVPEECKFLS